MNIRTASPADVHQLHALERCTASRPWSRDSLTAWIANPTSLALIAEHSGVPVGHALFTAVLDEGELLSLGVDPSWRRRGFARHLLREMAARWHSHPVAVGWLEVRADNQPARSLYEGLGWTPHHVRRAYYDDGVDAVVMRWAITRP